MMSPKIFQFFFIQTGMSICPPIFIHCIIGGGEAGFTILQNGTASEWI